MVIPPLAKVVLKYN